MIVIVGVMTVVPIGLLVLNSFNVARPGRPSHYGLDNWRQAFANHELGAAILNTLKLGVTRTAIALVIATARPLGLYTAAVLQGGPTFLDPVEVPRNPAEPRPPGRLTVTPPSCRGIAAAGRSSPLGRPARTARC